MTACIYIPDNNAVLYTYGMHEKKSILAISVPFWLVVIKQNCFLFPFFFLLFFVLSSFLLFFHTSSRIVGIVVWDVHLFREKLKNKQYGKITDGGTAAAAPDGVGTGTEE